MVSSSLLFLSLPGGAPMGVRRWLGPVGADELMESRMDTSSIQYGAAATSSVRSTADPWMNFENLYTCAKEKIHLGMCGACKNACMRADFVWRMCMHT